MTTQVTLSHREKTAYVYVRQSTMGQVRNHQESTERQYALKDKAISLGWPAARMRILDGDLGISGATSSGRDDFKKLVAEVSLGEVGAVELLLATFRETGSAYAVAHEFASRGLRFPKRAYGGIWDGQLIWGHLTDARVLSVLKNPAYAG